MASHLISPAARPFGGTIRIPADKSISHRALILNAIAEGEALVENFLDSETTNATLDCLMALGAQIERSSKNALCVQGRGLRGLREPDSALFCKGSGTTMRLLAGLAAGQEFFTILDGTAALKRRPMRRVVEPLRTMGATIIGRAGDNLAPLAIRGRNPLRGLDYTLPVASAQVKSALLLAGLFADAPSTLQEPGRSRDHTERMLGAMGVQVESGEGAVRLLPPERLHARDISIPSDISSAAFVIAGALLVPGSKVRLERVGLNTTRTGLLDVLRAMGAEIEAEAQSEVCGEPVGDLVIRHASSLRGTDIGGNLIPRMIDEFPILGVAATQAQGETHVRDAAELRVKESDRILSLAEELYKMGAQIETREDGFDILGPVRLRGARVYAHHDHRLAMALAIAALMADGETVIDGWECVADSFPDFGAVIEEVQR